MLTITFFPHFGHSISTKSLLFSTSTTVR